MEAAIDAGADDLANLGDTYRVLTDPGHMESVRKALEAKGIKVDASAVELVPNNTVKVEGEDARKLLRLIEMLEEQDDVNLVSANYDIDDALIEQFSQQ
jgi:transcriptional/translational regulatory protein YebC/TACO1